MHFRRDQLCSGYSYHLCLKAQDNDYIGNASACDFDNYDNTNSNGTYVNDVICQKHRPK